MLHGRVNGRDRRPTWTVNCKDVFGRDREVHVRLDGTTVIVQVPPGEAAVLTGVQAMALRSALREAHELAYEQAERRTGGNETRRLARELREVPVLAGPSKQMSDSSE